MYVVGALEEGEEDAFADARAEYGERAEAVIAEFRQLNSVFALSLRPHAPHPETKRKLLEAVRQTMRGCRAGDGNVGGNHDH